MHKIIDYRMIGNFLQLLNDSEFLQRSCLVIFACIVSFGNHSVQTCLTEESILKAHVGTSLAVHWFGSHLLMQKTQVWSLVQDLRSYMPWGTWTLECLNKRSHILQLRLDSAKNKYINSLITLNSTCMCLVAQSCPTLCNPMDYSPPGSSVHGNSPDKNAGVGCCALLQGIFTTPWLNPGLAHYKHILYHLSHRGSPYVAVNWFEGVTWTFRRRQWHPTPVLLPGKSHGWRSLVGCSRWVAKSRTRLSDFPFTFHFHALEKEMATRSSVLAWRIPGTGEPHGLPSTGSHRVGHDWSDLAAAAAAAWTFANDHPGRPWNSALSWMFSWTFASQTESAMMTHSERKNPVSLPVPFLPLALHTAKEGLIDFPSLKGGFCLHRDKHTNIILNETCETSLVVQCLRLCAPTMQQKVPNLVSSLRN